LDGRRGGETEEGNITLHGLGVVGGVDEALRNINQLATTFLTGERKETTW